MRLRPADIPNAICVLRILLVVPIVASLLQGSFLLALALIFVAGLSDGLDGYLAKRFDWRTRLGGVLDPFADKLLLVSVFVTLAWLGIAPVWLTVVVLARDLVIVAGALTYNFLIGLVQPNPTRISKINTGLQLLYILFAVSRSAFGWPPSISLLVVGAGVFVASVVSGLDYVITWSGRARAAASD
jgi:cardiolipin synthase